MWVGFSSLALNLVRLESLTYFLAGVIFATSPLKEA